MAQVIARGLDALGAAQQPQGDFRENISSADSAESTAQVLVTLCTLGIDPLQDSRFISSQGKTVLDGLERYYLTGGGFRHQLSENTADVLATQQGIYALTAYIRFCDGKGSLYDFSDIILWKSPAGRDKITAHNALLRHVRSLLKHLIRADQCMRLYLYFIVKTGLRTEFAVLRAFSTLYIDTAADIKHISAEMLSDLICRQTKLV